MMWLVTMFIYIPNNLGLEYYGFGTVPIAWLWSRLSDNVYGLTSWAYLSFFVFYGLASCVELGTYIMYLV